MLNEFSRHSEQSWKAAALFPDCVALFPADPPSTDGGFRAANVLITHYIWRLRRFETLSERGVGIQSIR